jgi:squalene synthase HpnC
MTVEEAYNHCSALARAHYENFPVGRLVPGHLQKHVHAVYAFARYADDMADEGYVDDGMLTGSTLKLAPGERLSPQERLKALDEWESFLFKPIDRQTPPTFIAVQQTIRELGLPVSLFTDLLSAFKQDVVKRRYANFTEVLDYCRRSANPVGRLVLLLHGHRDPQQLLWSDHICTALQLANFWQDVSVDLRKDRIYLPLDDRERFRVSEDDLFNCRVTPGFLRLMRFQVDRAQSLFDQGAPLPATLPGLLRLEIRLTWLSGASILRKIEDLNYDTLTTRPKVGKSEFITLLGQALVAR